MATPNPDQTRDENTIKLLRFLYQQRFSIAENIEPAKRALVTPAYFYGWVDRQLNLMDPATECEAAGVPVEPVWAFMREIIEGGLAPERLQQYWYWICMPDKPDNKHKLASLNCVLLLTWEDGTIMPISTHVVPEMLGKQQFTDPIVAQIVRNNVVGAFVGSIVEQGLDALHDSGKNYRGPGPEDAYDMFCGVFMKVMREGFKEGPMAPTIKPLVENYFRLAQAIIRPPIPPNVRAAIEAQRRKQEAEADGKVIGGWDVDH